MTQSIIKQKAVAESIGCHGLFFAYYIPMSQLLYLAPPLGELSRSD